MDGTINSEDPLVQQPHSKWNNLRVIAGFWLLGMCNNYIYGIMLSAANDVIIKVENVTNNDDFSRNTYARDCNAISTGAVLLADIIPNLLVAAIFPFLPFMIHVRMVTAVLTGILALVLVGLADAFNLVIIGVCLASFNSGLGEVTLLAYSTLFPLTAVAAWSSGTGGAGLVSSFAYAGMTDGGLTPATALYISVVVPFIFATAFWVILMKPNLNTSNPAPEQTVEPQSHYQASNPVSEKGEYNLSFSQKMLVVWRAFLGNITYIPKLLPFMIPMGLVYYFEYLINSGLFELFYFENTPMTKSSQFRWFNALYQIGVFASRSSVTWIKIQRIWIMSVLQAINLVLFILEAIYGFIPNVWIMFVLIFWEGLLGGSAYVNTFHKMSIKVPEDKKIFAMSIGSTAITLGIVAAGLTSFPVHEGICMLPFEPIFRWPA